NTQPKLKDIALDGLVRQNPILRLVLGTCPTLALSTAVTNGLGMGMAVTFVLICSNLMISLLRNLIPDKVRIPAFVMVIATFVTATELVVAKFSPELYESLGVYLPLVVVNCIILARAESFASGNKPLAAAADGLFMGLGYTMGITLISVVREVLGFGTFAGIELWNFKIGFFAQPAGAFFTFAMAIFLFNAAYNSFTKRRKDKFYHTQLAKKYAANAAKEG
ncbi:MAG: electron transport complex subunit RsxE, partial [Clostridia bacterium]